MNTLTCNKHNYNRIDNAFSFIIILMPFLQQYKGAVSVISFSETILIPFIIWFCVVDRGLLHQPVDKPIAVFYGVTIVTTLFCLMFYYSSIFNASTVLFRLVYYAIIVFIARRHFNIDFAIKIYSVAVFLFSVYLIIQNVYNAVTGLYLPISFNETWIFSAEAAHESLDEYYQYHFRPSSLFLEPSYYTLFTMPYVILALNRKKQTVFSVINLIVTVAAIVLSTATSGVVGLLIIFACYLFGKAENANVYKTLIKVFIVAVAIALVVGYIFYSESTVLAERLSTGGSIKQRIIRGLIIYDDLPPLHKIIGVGINNLEDYMLSNNMVTKFDEFNLNYCCSLVQTFIFSGVIGGISLIAYIASLFLRYFKSKTSDISVLQNYSVRNIMIGMIFLILFIFSYETILFSYRFAFLIIILESILPKKESKNRS